MNRADALAALDGRFDVLVIGGGATGLGTAVDAASRGYRTALVERGDFASATSSRSTKLVHGGIRYLRQGDIGLVREALRERTALLHNAPHVVRRLGFVCPAYRWNDVLVFSAGFKAYDLLAGRSPFAPSRRLGRDETLRLLPDLRARGLRGAIRYEDGQFDDARFALALARTASDLGAAVANYARVERFTYANGRIAGAVVVDEETGAERDVRATVTINATGIFVDTVRRLDDADAAPLLSFSRGSHVVFPASVFRGRDALLVPKTADGRVLFAVPWLGSVLAGTTDVPVREIARDVAPTRDEAAFVVAQLNAYLEHPLERTQAVASFAGLRPLVRGDAASTAQLSREHLVDVSRSGLVTVTGGKWTTYRRMAEDALDAAVGVGGLPAAPCRTAALPLHGSPGHAAASSGEAWKAPDGDAPAFAVYGTDRAALARLERGDPHLAEPLHARLPYTFAHVAFAAREEAARTLEDVLARRTRALTLDVAAAREAAPAVAALLARELGRDDRWIVAEREAFERVAAANAAPLAAAAPATPGTSRDAGAAAAAPERGRA